MSNSTLRPDRVTSEGSDHRRSTLRASWQSSIGRLVRPLHWRSVDALRIALVQRDTERIRMTLHDDVALVIGNGTATGSSPRVLTGIRSVTDALLYGTLVDRTFELDLRAVNGQAGLVLHRGHEVTVVMCVDLTAGLISAIWVRLQPDQLRNGNHI